MRVSLFQALREVRKAAASSTGGGVPSAFFVPSGRGGSAVPVDWDLGQAIREGFKRSSWVYACVDRLAGAASSVPWRVMTRRGSEWEQADGDPLELAIEYPNDAYSRQFLMHVAVQHLCLGGNSLLKAIFVTRNRMPQAAELWLLPPTIYRPVAVDEKRPAFDASGRQLHWIEGYQRTDRPGEPLLAPSAVVHAQLPDPSNLLWGMSPVQALARAVNMDVAMVEWNAGMPERSLIPSGAFIDRNLRTASQLDEAAKNLQERFAGKERAGTPLVLGHGTDWLRMSLSPVEMAWLESRAFTRDEICAVFGMLASLFISDSKYANQESGVKHMWKNGAHRVLRVLEDALNTRLIPRSERRTKWIHFDLSVVPDIQDTLAERLEAHERAVASAIPPNRSFILLDLPIEPVEGGDEPLISAKLMPLRQMLDTNDGSDGADDGTDDLSAPTPNAAPPPPPDPADQDPDSPDR